MDSSFTCCSSFSSSSSASTYPCSKIRSNKSDPARLSCNSNDDNDGGKNSKTSPRKQLRGFSMVPKGMKQLIETSTSKLFNRREAKTQRNTKKSPRQNDSKKKKYRGIKKKENKNLSKRDVDNLPYFSSNPRPVLLTSQTESLIDVGYTPHRHNHHHHHHHSSTINISSISSSPNSVSSSSDGSWQTYMKKKRERLEAKNRQRPTKISPDMKFLSTTTTASTSSTIVDSESECTMMISKAYNECEEKISMQARNAIKMSKVFGESRGIIVDAMMCPNSEKTIDTIQQPSPLPRSSGHTKRGEDNNSNPPVAKLDLELIKNHRCHHDDGIKSQQKLKKAKALTPRRFENITKLFHGSKRMKKRETKSKLKKNVGINKNKVNNNNNGNDRPPSPPSLYMKQQQQQKSSKSASYIPFYAQECNKMPIETKLKKQRYNNNNNNIDCGDNDEDNDDDYGGISCSTWDTDDYTDDDGDEGQEDTFAISQEDSDLSPIQDVPILNIEKIRYLKCKKGHNNATTLKKKHRDGDCHYDAEQSCTKDKRQRKRGESISERSILNYVPDIQHYKMVLFKHCHKDNIVVDNAQSATFTGHDVIVRQSQCCTFKGSRPIVIGNGNKFFGEGPVVIGDRNQMLCEKYRAFGKVNIDSDGIRFYGNKSTMEEVSCK